MRETAAQATASGLPSSTGHFATPALRVLLAQAVAFDPVEQAASFGRWWYHADSGEMVLTRAAADMVGVAAGWHVTLEAGFINVLADDRLQLSAMLRESRTSHLPLEWEFRIFIEGSGLRWLRLKSIPQTDASAICEGILTDITAARHAAMRERLSFETTRLFVGADSIGVAVTKVIQLVCENLGWDWGAYWTVQADSLGERKLALENCWHAQQESLALFTEESLAMQVRPGTGLVGQVWQQGEPRWVENMNDDRDFLRSETAIQCQLRSGYIFPVAYVTDEGYLHCPGVLEFYSRLTRQSEAQLPTLSATIGALIAQTAQRLEQQETIRQLAQIDGLTELANRSHFYQILEANCKQSAANGSVFGLIFIDLDRFKPVNDAFGHEAGNVVLRGFSQRVQALPIPGKLVGRLGGDEFAILYQPDGSDTPFNEQLDALVRQVLHAAQIPFMFNGHEITVSASIGISIYPDNGLNGPELLRGADTAMYRIKKNGRNAMSYFASSTSYTLAVQQSDLAQRLTMETELHQAIADEAFYLEYQPIFAGNGQIHAIEALIRWRRANGNIVRPDVFIPIAEESRLIIQIGNWVVHRACHDLARLHRSGFENLKVHVNMAASEFTSSNLPDELRAIVDKSGIKPHHLCLELTESMLMQQPDHVIPIMSTLRRQGFGISLDDFGMGYSSLAHLKNLPISSMKIDRSFIKGLPQQSEDRAIVRTIIELGRNLHLNVIAEGVETDNQLAFLRQFGDTFIQGFVLSKPKPVDELIRVYGAGVVVSEGMPEVNVQPHT
ncbi:putative bifunctional diguanylate cyclase/phosphodiesterase [Undibacterium sp. TJN19]|uniref:putative bifunctional diguanylate cyclase/phosphodiesterase n=1 Tax=Undibacterium sp. TJN19 TaxID=3413055 RepID=UPI003BF1BF8A